MEGSTVYRSILILEEFHYNAKVKCNIIIIIIET